MNTFWTTIAQAAESDDFQAGLTLALLGLNAEQINAFEAEWADASGALHDVLNLDVIYTLWGGCGDDGFMDFKSWILARGQAMWAAVVADPLAALAPWSDPLGPVPTFEGAIYTPFADARDAGPMAPEAHERWRALLAREAPSGAEADEALAALSRSDAEAVMADRVLRRYFASRALPEVLFRSGAREDPVAAQWIDGLTRGQHDAASLARLTLEDAPAVRCAAEQSGLQSRRARRALRSLRGVDDDLVIPLLLAIGGEPRSTLWAFAEGSAVMGRLALHELRGSPERPDTWILLLGRSGSPDAVRWLAWSAQRGDYRHQPDCYAALAGCCHPLATPEMLRSWTQGGGDDAALRGIEAVPDAALIAVVADEVPRMRGWDEHERCWHEAARCLARRPPRPTIVAALRAVSGSEARQTRAAWALAMLEGDRRGEASLLTALRQYADDPEHRGAVWRRELIEALGRIRSAAAVPLVRRWVGGHAIPLSLLALERIEPGRWQAPLRAAVPALAEHLREALQMQEEGFLFAWQLDQARAAAREVLEVLEDSTPGAAELSALLDERRRPDGPPGAGSGG